MSTSQKRDAGMDRLLGAALTASRRDAASACPEAALLAAFVEGSLTGNEQSDIDAHIVNCGRCQEALAILAHDLPSPEAVEVAPRETGWFTWVTRPRLRWLVPISAAATVAVVIFATRPLIAPEQEIASVEAGRMAQAPAPTATLPEAGLDTVREKSAAVPEKSEFAGSPESQETGRRQANQLAGARQTADAPPSTQVGQAALDKKSLGNTVAVEASDRIAADEKRARAAAEPVAPQAAAAPAAAPAPAARKPAADALRAMPAAPRLDEELRRLEPMATVTAAPDGRVRWRLGPGGRIWQSTDAGSTWHWQPSDVSANLVAGSAPSATTCWAVGTGGVVLLTVDGQRWTLLPFPLRVDLAAVQAIDARSATVTTRDGRRFETLDAGLTWSQKQ